MIKSQYLKDKFNLIEVAFNTAKASIIEPQLASMLSGYLVVFISGSYEDCIEYLFIQRAGKNNDRELGNLVKTLIHRQFRNPEYGKIKELVNALNPLYGKKMDLEIDTKSKEGIDSIVNNKNNVAHGKVSNATLNDIINYHNNALKIFEELENILLHNEDVTN